MVTTRTAESPSSTSKAAGLPKKAGTIAKNTKKPDNTTEIIVEQGEADSLGNFSVTVKELKPDVSKEASKCEENLKNTIDAVSQEGSNGDDGQTYNEDQYRQESCTFESFRDALKSKKAISERWSISGILWDASSSLRLIVASELDITLDGSMRVKRCVKVRIIVIL